jgi:hypothetical protein
VALLFVCVYVRVVCFPGVLGGAPEGVLRNTPRKNALQRRPNDLQRFLSYLAVRCGWVLFSVVLVGWVGAASTMRTGGRSLGSR